jgi:uncharacterized membrane protein YedE/YeeE
MDELPISTLVAGLAFLGGTALGMTARSIQFCTLGAIADAFMTANHTRLRGWALAVATAILLTQGLHMNGLIDIYDSIYLVPDFGWLGAILGGLCFGFGMALVGTCGLGTLVRLGGGDLRSLVDFLVLGIVAYMTLRGLTGLGRVAFIEPTNADLSGLGSQGLVDAIAWLLGTAPEAIRATVVGLAVIALLAYCFTDRRFRHSRPELLGGAIIGLLVASGWAITGLFGADDFDPAPLESFTFVAPLGESLVYLMTFSGSVVNFGIGAVGGVIFGAFLAGWAKGELRLEAFDDKREMIRHFAGAALMGFGGVAAMGCTIGQGITGMSTLSLSAPLALGSIFAGAYLGLKYLVEGSFLRAVTSGFARY